MSYHDTVREMTRFKCRLKAKLQQHGLHCPTAEAFDPRRRETWLDRQSHPDARLQAKLLLEIIDLLSEQELELHREIDRRARTFEPIARLRELPGVGLIRAATFFTIVDTPPRFTNQRKLWAYCGGAVVRRSSGFTEGPEHRTAASTARSRPWPTAPRSPRSIWATTASPANTDACSPAGWAPRTPA